MLKLICLSTAALAASTIALSAETLRMGHAYETSSAYHQRALEAAEAIAERTEGRYEIDVFPASQLGGQAEMNESINLGSLDMGYVSPGLMAEIYAPIQIHLAPFIWHDQAHFDAYLGSDIYKEITGGYEDASGNKILGLTYYGKRHVTSNKAIKEPADMKGLKLRIPPVPILTMFSDAVGANATPIAFAEVYLALQQGTVDAQENPLPTIKTKKFYEVQSHLALTGHITDGFFTVVNGDVWADMSDEDKAIFEEEWGKAASEASADIVAQEAELVDWFEEQGMTVTHPDRAAFAALVEPKWKSSDIGWTDAQIDAILALDE